MRDHTFSIGLASGHDAGQSIVVMPFYTLCKGDSNVWGRCLLESPNCFYSSHKILQHVLANISDKYSIFWLNDLYFFSILTYGLILSPVNRRYSLILCTVSERTTLRLSNHFWTLSIHIFIIILVLLRARLKTLFCNAWNILHSFWKFLLRPNRNAGMTIWHILCKQVRFKLSNVINQHIFYSGRTLSETDCTWTIDGSSKSRSFDLLVFSRSPPAPPALVSLSQRAAPFVSLPAFPSVSHRRFANETKRSALYTELLRRSLLSRYMCRRSDVRRPLR